MVIRVAGLFAGIGGIEYGFKQALGQGVETVLLCESWDPAQRVLRHRFPEVELHPDVRALHSLPKNLDVVAAGFPCTDLSQAGRTAGIRGSQSGLVSHVFDILKDRAAKGIRLPTVLIENVPNMLSLSRGEAMRYLVHEFDELGYRWAYRVVDTRSTGLPQRRRRVLLVASVELDPRQVLFADEAQERPITDYRDDAFGFYWTEGLGGLGWAPDAVPTLKGGSTIGIASPPAIWLPYENDPIKSLVTPGVASAESLQGFPVGWTDLDFNSAPARTRGMRWKLLGNAVSTRVSEWVAGRIADPGDVVCPTVPWGSPNSWPTAACGSNGSRERIEASEYPILRPYEHLLEHVELDVTQPLSARAVNGFHSRLRRGNLGWHPGFREAVSAADDRLHGAPVEVEA